MRRPAVLERGLEHDEDDTAHDNKGSHDDPQDRLAALAVAAIKRETLTGDRVFRSSFRRFLIDHRTKAREHIVGI